MSGDPRLPESDDPFEVLGVSRGASETELKRAYVRLLKVFRPERAPEEFQRLRAAYEAAVEQTRAFAEPRWPPAWADDAQASPQGGIELPPGTDHAEPSHETFTGRPFVERFLRDEAAGSASVEALHEGLAAGASLADWILVVLRPDELRELAADPRCRWEVIARQPNAAAALALFCARVDALLSRGEQHSLADELRSESFRDVAGRVPWLRHLVLRVACALAFDAPREADDLFDIYADDRFGAAGLEDVFLHRRECRSDWAAWDAAFGDLRALRRFLSSFHSLAREDLALAALAGAIRRDPKRHLAAFDRFASASLFFDLFLEAVGSVVFFEAAEREPPDLSGFVTATEAELDGDRQTSIDNWILVCLILTSIGVFLRHGWWGFVPVAVTVGWLMFSLAFGDPRLYARIVRRRALDEIVLETCSPSELAAAIASHEGVTAISRFAERLDHDAGLHALAMSLRFASPASARGGGPRAGHEERTTANAGDLS